MNTLRKIVFISIFILFANSLYSQTFIDSVNVKLNEYKTLNEKIEFLNDYSNFLRKRYKIQQAQDVSLLAVDLVEKNGIEELYSISYSYLGLTYRDQSKFNESVEYYNKALKYAELLNQKTQMAYGYNNIATIERILSNYTSSIELIYKSLSIFREIGDIKGESNCHVNLGILFRYQKKYDKAIEHLTSAEKIRIEVKDTLGLAQVNYLLAETYFHNKELSTSIKYYKKAESLYDYVYKDNTTSKTSIYMGLAGAYYELGKYEAALDYRKKALVHIEKIGDNNSLARVYLGIGKIYTKLKKYRLAETNLLKALKEAEDANIKTRILDISRSLAELYESWGKISKALGYFQEYSSLKDSVYSKDTKEEIAKIEALYKGKQKDKENELLNTKLNLETQKSFYSTLVSVLSVLLILLFYILYRKTSKNNKLLKELNDSKDLFFSIISHDIKNPFARIINNSELLISNENKLDEDEVVELTSSIHKSAKLVYDLLDNLLKWSQIQRGKLRFERSRIHLIEIVEEVFEFLRVTADNKNISLKSNIPDSHYVFADPVSIKAVFRNLINNAIKFSNNGSEVVISSKKINDRIIIDISDNGVGIKEDIIKNLFKIESEHSSVGTSGEKGSGLGLIICKEFIERNGGDISVKSELGIGSTFSFRLLSI
ncbi:MAG: tetratricopeptide repeat-containing sensor histidine kinase [Melioribacteraceae bacterium]|nr:tetratricopeptide repeat-containing sensor histidine kinase [Melioribacteraceae bacterium]